MIVFRGALFEELTTVAGKDKYLDSIVQGFPTSRKAT
jgi:hypothetical protein